MKILATMPIYNAPELARRSIESLGDVDKYFVYNSAEPAIQEIYSEYGGYNFGYNANCNPAWNKGMEYFLKGDWDWLALGSSDVVLHKDWAKIIDSLSAKNEVYVPNWDISTESMDAKDAELFSCTTELTGGVMGAFTFLPRKAVEIIHPIPEQFKLWWGDVYIFTKLRNRGYKIMELNHLYAYHFVSTGVVACPNFTGIIKKEQKLWDKLDPEVLK